MSSKHSFGGEWTVEKLNILSEYLDFYLTALKKQPFNKIYVDAFAGSGGIWLDEAGQTIEGSARLALKTQGAFDRYVFIEKNKAFASQLNQMILLEFSQRAPRVETHVADCNSNLLRFCRDTDWRKNRALMFLDPYSMEVKWNTLEAIARTGAIDVWYLFPLSAANRLMRKDGRIDDSWRVKLNEIFGDDGWVEEFYRPDPRLSFFEEDNHRLTKVADTESLSNYVCNRLASIFPSVANNPRILYNSKNSPLFLFCFAVANPRATILAMRAARHILDHSGR